MKEFLFKLFRLEWEPKRCESCELLKMLLESERRDKLKILDKLINPPEVELTPISSEPPKPIGASSVPWHVMRRRLEEQHKLKKEVEEGNKLVDQQVEKLEKELGLEENIG